VIVLVFLLSIFASPSSKPVNSKASAKAIELYNYLLVNYGKKTISGVMTLQGGDDADSLKEPNWVYNQTGKYPVLVGLDFMHQTGKDESWYYNDSRYSGQVVRDSVDWYGRGGIVALCWHWRDPSKESNEFYSPSSGNTATNYDINTGLDSSGSNYNNVLADLDQVATELKKLRDQGIAVLWRPLHEAAGGWFWWGYKGAEPLKKLWKLMYDRYTNFHGLDNLIWVWTTDTNNDALDWYPGDDVVDVVGVDTYMQSHDPQNSAFSTLKNLYKDNKILTFSECGYIPDPDQAFSAGTTWSYFMTWYGSYTTSDNSADYWKTIFASNNVLTLADKGKWS
jgi:mannan endo-1,4-beta-mannosidase